MIRAWRRVVHGARGLFMRRRMEREMREEMAQHLERSIERLMGRGMSRGEAERAARREFGNEDVIQEHARDARGGRWLETLLSDLRYGARQLVRTPLLSATMIGVLALGIGSNVALFSVIDSFVNRPGPGIAPDSRLVRVRGLMQFESGAFTTREGMSYPEYAAYASRHDVLSEAAAYAREYGVVELDVADPVAFHAEIHFVTPGYFPLLGVQAADGPGLPLTHVDGTEADVAVISDVVWRTYFGEASDIAGKTIHVNGRPLTIVGVAPRRFTGTNWHSGQRLVWVPMTAMPAVMNRGPGVFADADSARVDVIARLAPNIDAREATSRLQGMAGAFKPGWLESGRTGTDVVPLRIYNEDSSGDILWGAAAGALICLLILLVTCTNVAGLQLGRALTRRREIGVRLSLGAGRGRVVRQLLTESVLIALVAGLLAMLIVRSLIVLLPGYPPGVDVVINHRAALFTFSFALLTGIAFGLAPALHASRLALGDVLKDAAAAVSAPRTRLQGGLIVAQVAFTQPLLLVLAVSLFTMTREARAAAARPEFERLINVRADFVQDVQPAQKEALLRPAEDALRSVPGVAGVVLHGGQQMRLELQVHPDDQLDGTRTDVLRVRGDLISPGYFDLMGIPLLRGADVPEPGIAARQRGPLDAAQRRAMTAELEELDVVIGDDVARRLWGSADPIGRRFVRADDRRGNVTRTYSVVGVVDHRAAGPGERNGLFRMYVENTLPVRSWLVRTHVPAASLGPVLQRELQRASPALAVTSMETLAADAARERRQAMQVMALAGVGGSIVLLLSAVGLAALVARSVALRLREVGIRTALGAAPHEVVRHFSGRGVRLAALGVLLGLPVSVYGVYLATADDFDRVGHTALLSALPIAVVVLAIAAFASWLPARHAARLDPVQVLRAD